MKNQAINKEMRVHRLGTMNPDISPLEKSFVDVIITDRHGLPIDMYFCHFSLSQTRKSGNHWCKASAYLHDKVSRYLKLIT